jgi:hypothetical protein
VGEIPYVGDSPVPIWNLAVVRRPIDQISSPPGYTSPLSITLPFFSWARPDLDFSHRNISGAGFLENIFRQDNFGRMPCSIKVTAIDLAQIFALSP